MSEKNFTLKELIKETFLITKKQLNSKYGAMNSYLLSFAYMRHKTRSTKDSIRFEFSNNSQLI